MALNVLDYVTFVGKKDQGDRRGLLFFPFGIVKSIEPNGTIIAKSIEDRRTPLERYHPSELSTFELEVNTDEEFFVGSLEDFESNVDMMVIYNPEDGQENIYHLDLFYEGYIQLVLPDKNLERRAKMRQSLADLSSMSQVSKQGTMAHLPLVNNVKGKILSYISGFNVGETNEKTHQKVLQEALTRRMNAQGPGVNTRYGKPVRVRTEFNKALNQAALPHGPTEENFMGGKRKSLRKIGTQMARRGTRRSKGIFSRLYSPIGHLLAAGKESVGAVTNTAKGVVGEGIHGLDKIGRSVTKHANMAVKDVFTRKGGKRKAKGTRKSRKSRRSTRRRR